MLRAIGRVIQLAFFAVVGLAVFASIYFAPELGRLLGKNYWFPEVEIEATVHPDGSLSVVEHRTFEFRGSFSFAYYTLQHRLPGDVEEFSISEGSTPWVTFPTGDPTLGPTSPGVYTVEDGPGEFKATWYFSAQDERRTFTIRYRRRCAVELLSDAGYLNWQAIGTGWEETTDLARITIHLPGHPERGPVPLGHPREACRPGNEPRAGIRRPATPLRPGETLAFAHGPLQGTVAIADPQTVVLEVADLQPGQFYEAGILFPSDAVIDLGPPASPVVGPDPPATVSSAEEVLAAEARLAVEANAARSRARFIDGVWRLLAILMAPFLAAMVIWSYRRDRVAGVPRHLQEPPEPMHPAELALLWSAYRGRFAPKDAYRAQLLHLASEGVISVASDGRVSDPKDLSLRLVRDPADQLDRSFVAFLFDDGGGRDGEPVHLGQVKARGGRAARLRGWWRYAFRRTKQPIDRLKNGQTRLESVLAFVWAGAAGATAFWAFERNGTRVALLVIPAALVSWLVATRLIPPRLPAALRTRLARWKAFRRFLTEFSNLAQAPALAYVIWERYLVYATALGVADRVAKQVRALVPENALPSPWPGAPPGSDGYRWASSVSTRAPAHAAVSTSGVVSGDITWSGSWGSASSGSGGGGGASGGGGGGGGGSGGGAG